MDYSSHKEYQVYLSDQYIFSLINQFTKLKPGNLAVQYSEKPQSNKITWNSLRLPSRESMPCEKRQSLLS